MVEEFNEVKGEDKLAISLLKEVIQEKALHQGQITIGICTAQRFFGRTNVYCPSVLISVLIEALVTKWALAHPLVEVLALLLTQVFLVICEQPSFFLCSLHPEPAGADVVRGLPALADAGQAEAVRAVWKDPKPCLPLGLVKDSLHADTASLLLAPGHRKAQLHVPLVFLEALSQVAATLVKVGRV